MLRTANVSVHSLTAGAPGRFKGVTGSPEGAKGGNRNPPPRPSGSQCSGTFAHRRWSLTERAEDAAFLQLPLEGKLSAKQTDEVVQFHAHPSNFIKKACLRFIREQADE